MHLPSSPTGLTFFMTDTWSMTYSSPTSLFSSGSLAFPDTLILGSWNHVMVYFEDGTNVFLSCTGNIYPMTPKKTGNASFRKIFFCQNSDTSNTSTPCISTTIKWFDAFYRDIRIWDATSTNGWAIMQYNNLYLKNYY